MTDFAAAMLPGERLHLQHGPIDLVIGADGSRETAFDAAKEAFAGLLQRLVDELALLRTPVGTARPEGPVARRMFAAVERHTGFVTPMAAVAGSVADYVLAAMTAQTNLRRAYVNNGGDIALHLAPGESFRLAVAGLRGQRLGAVGISAESGIRGVATSGRGGRSLSMGIAESVTVLARDAASADVAATLIANAVDLPGHPEISRVPADEMRPDSDLGRRLVVQHVGQLTMSDAANALESGMRAAEGMRAKGLIHAAALFLDEQSRILGGQAMIGMREAENA